MNWLDGIEDQPEWMQRARCQGTDAEAFFPEVGGSTREAKRICRRCEVQPDCREYALTTRQPAGVWGGLSDRERRRLLRRMRAGDAQ